MYEPGAGGSVSLCRARPVPVRTREICSSSLPLHSVQTGAGATLVSTGHSALLHASQLLASGETDLQQTNALVWVMVGMSAAGAIITFSFLVYSIWKYRDPKVKGRRYG